MGSTWNSGPDKGRREDSTPYVANVPWLTYLNKVDLPPADAGAVEHPHVRWGRGPAYCARVEGPNVRRQVLKGRGAGVRFSCGVPTSLILPRWFAWGCPPTSFICALDPPHGFWGFFFHWPAVS